MLSIKEETERNALAKIIYGQFTDDLQILEHVVAQARKARNALHSRYWELTAKGSGQ